jgi:outer membrane protein assembly factor BamA
MKKEGNMNNKLMKNGMAIGVAVLLCGVASPTAFGYSQNLTNNGVVWNYGFEGDTYPTNEFFAGAFWLEDPQTAPNVGYTTSFATAGPVTNGFVINNTSNNGVGYRIFGPSTVVPNTNTWTIELRARINSVGSVLWQGGIDFRSPSAGFLLAFSTNDIIIQPSGFVAGATNTAFAVGNDFHTYRVKMDGKTYALFVDDLTTPLLTTAGGVAPGFSMIEFGDYGGTIGAGEVEYDYIRWTPTIPEPGAGVLLGLGGLLAWAQRRKKTE